jgi:Ni,Fe-hydrogenase I small subunit
VPRVTGHGTKMVTVMVIWSAVHLWLQVARNCAGCTVPFVAHTGTAVCNLLLTLFSYLFHFLTYAFFTPCIIFPVF